MPKSYKYSAGKKHEVDPVNAQHTFEFYSYTHIVENITVIDYDTDQINQISASNPSPLGNILLIKTAMEFIKDPNNRKKPSYHHRVINKWVDFLEYIYANQGKIVFKVFDFQTKFSNKLQLFKEKLCSTNFSENDVFLLIYEEGEIKDSNKLRLIGGGNNSVLLFPSADMFFNTWPRSVGVDTNNNKVNVFEKDEPYLRTFETRSKAFYDWVAGFIGELENQDQWWDALINCVDRNHYQTNLDKISVLDVISQYFSVIINPSIENKITFLNKSSLYLDLNSSLSNLYSDTQALGDMQINNLNEYNLSAGLMQITIPEARGTFSDIKFNEKNYNALTSTNSKEYFLYPFTNEDNQTTCALTKMIDPIKGTLTGYFFQLTTGNDIKFYIYNYNNVVSLSAYFLSHFPCNPMANGMWVMLQNTPENTHQIYIKEIYILNDENTGNNIKITESQHSDIKIYYFNQNRIPSNFLIQASCNNQQTYKGILKRQFEKIIYNDNQVKVSIDLGTSNTYACYQVNNGQIQEIIYDPKELYGLLYEFNPHLESHNWFNELSSISNFKPIITGTVKEIYRSFYPMHLGQNTSHKLPTYSALRQLTDNKAVPRELKYKFGFHYSNDKKGLSQSVEYITEMKWENDGTHYVDTLNALKSFIESYLIQKENVHLHNISWIITQPQAILEREGWGIPNVKMVDEALAPLHFINYKFDRIPINSLFANIDIGGGTIDIGIAYSTNNNDYHVNKTSCFYGFNKLLESFPGDNLEIESFWSKRKIYSEHPNSQKITEIKRNISKNGLELSEYGEYKPMLMKNLLLYYSSIVWHVADLIKVHLTRNSDTYTNLENGIYLQFTGQGANFIKDLFSNRGVPRIIGNSTERQLTLAEYNDSETLHSFHRVFFNDKIFDNKSINIRIDRENNSKKFTAFGALLDPLAGNEMSCRSEVLASQNELKILGFDFDSELKIDVLNGFDTFIERIGSRHFIDAANALTGHYLSTTEIVNIQKFGKESIDSIVHVLKDKGGNEQTAAYVAAVEINGVYRLSSSPLLWPFYGTFHKF